MRTCRRLLTFLLALLALAPLARAGAVTHLAVDDVRVGPHRRHVLLVRAEDAAGEPVAGLATQLTARLDGDRVREFAAHAGDESGGRGTTVIVIEAELLSPGSNHAPEARALLTAIAGALPPEDRVVVIAAGAAERRRELPASELHDGLASLDALAGQGGAKLPDAVAHGVEIESGRLLASSGIVVVIAATAPDVTDRMAQVVLAHAGGPRGQASLVAAPIGDSPRPLLAELARQTGGEQVVVRGADDAKALATVVRSLRRRYEVTFLPPEHWDAGAARHRVEVRLEQAGVALAAPRDYDLGAVSEPAWWSLPWVWVAFVALVLAGAFVFLRLRPRQLALLVVQGGEDDGVWFEVFSLPCSIGSGGRDHVLVTGEGVSPGHCMLQLDEGRFVLVDANSEGGTFVQGQRIRRRELADDDEIRLGTELRLGFEDHR